MNDALPVNSDELRKPVALPRRKFFSEMPDKGLFVIVAVAGFCLIIWGKRHGVGSGLAATISVLAMLVYGAIAYSIPTVQLRLDRLGDNFYYLGFIYTLASLSASLIELESGRDTQSLLGNFGIALVTTICGIAGRVLFVQMRSEIDEVEEVNRRNLVQISAELKSGLAATLRDFETFRTGVLQATREATATNLVEVTERLGKIEARLSETASTTAAALYDNAEALNKAAASLRDSANTVQSTLSVALRRPDEQVAQEMQALTIQMKTLSEALAANTAARRRWPRLVFRKWGREP